MKRECSLLGLLCLLSLVVSTLVFVTTFQAQQEESQPPCIWGCDTVFLTQSCDWICSPPGSDCSIPTSPTSPCKQTSDSGPIYARQCKACGGIQFQQMYV